MTESDVLRGALAAALGCGSGAAVMPPAIGNGPDPRSCHIKLSVRLTRGAAFQLDRHARAAGLSRGAYLTRLIEGAPPVTASADRARSADALSASADELAIFSRDIHHLTDLLRSGSVPAALQYRERLETLEADVRAHLNKAAATLAALASERTRPHGPTTPTTPRRNSP